MRGLSDIIVLRILKGEKYTGLCNLHEIIGTTRILVRERQRI